MPPTGVSLPFISYGGTSTVIMMAGVGILLNISRYANLDRS
jgi:cell division protein FtsW